VGKQASLALLTSPASTDQFQPSLRAASLAGLTCPAMLAGRINRARSGDQGAAAVEFALVVPILVMMLFGIIDYGLYFTNSLAVRAGVSDAARQIIVGNFSRSCEEFADFGEHGDLLAKVRDCVQPVADDEASFEAHVTYDTSWTAGQNVIVCASVLVDGLTGLTPRPNGGWVSARVALPIQQSTVPGSLPPPDDSCN
jgi:TadE-like protein